MRRSPQGNRGRRRDQRSLNRPDKSKQRINRNPLIHHYAIEGTERWKAQATSFSKMIFRTTRLTPGTAIRSARVVRGAQSIRAAAIVRSSSTASTVGGTNAGRGKRAKSFRLQPTTRGSQITEPGPKHDRTTMDLLSRRSCAACRLRSFYAIAATAVLAFAIASPAGAQTFTLYDPAISSSPQTVASAPLSDLLVSGSYIQVDSSEFNNFSFTGAAFGSGAITPSASDILITAPDSSKAELEFTGGPFFAIAGQFVDANLKFDVTELNPAERLTSAAINYTGGTNGSGITSISEDVDDMNNNLIGEGTFAITQNSGSNIGTINFPGQQEIQVSKDILVYGSAGGDNISDFTQDFGASPVPEPSSIAMALIASSGIGLVAWRKRKTFPTAT